MAPSTEQEPFGRPRSRWYVIFFVASWVVLISFYVAVRRATPSAVVSPWTAFGLLVTYSAWAAYGFVVYRWWRTRARGVRAERGTIIEISMVRRVLAVGWIACPFVIFVPRMHFDLSWGAVLALVVFASAPTYHWFWMREQIVVDEQGIRRTRGFGKRSIAWSEVAGLRVLRTGMVVQGPRGRSLFIWNQLLDGYPELVREVLARVPARIIEASGGRELLLQQAAVLEAPAGRGR